MVVQWYAVLFTLQPRIECLCMEPHHQENQSDHDQMILFGVKMLLNACWGLYRLVVVGGTFNSHVGRWLLLIKVPTRNSCFVRDYGGRF